MTKLSSSITTPTQPPAPPRAWRNLLRGLILLALSGLLLTFSFPAFNLWPLAFVALVPFVLCILRRPMTWRWLLVYYLFGSLWYSLNLYWLWPVTFGGTLALSFFLGLYWALFAWAAHRLIVQLRWPAMLVVPLTWLTIEYLTATVFTGFPWFLLGYAVAGSTTLLQSADLFGVWTLSALAAMTAGLLVDLLRLPLFRNGKPNPALLTLSASCLLILAAAVAYGLFRLGQHTTTAGPTLAVVQENIPQSLKDFGKPIDKDDIFNRHLRLSQAALADAKAHNVHLDLIAWPETMTVEPVNLRWLETMKPLTDYGREVMLRSLHFDAELRQLAASNHVNLLIGTPGITLLDNDTTLRQNDAVLYTSTGQQDPAFYAKRHLVPFGEYVPFKDSPWLNRALLYLTPYGSEGDYSNTPGNEWTRFEFTAADGRSYRFSVPICYEDVPTYIASAFAEPTAGHKRIDFLISITNDGWYESVNELQQHLRISQVRAVEHRVPVARSVNSGNSGFIDSSGRVTALVERNGTPYFVPGYAIHQLRLDSRITLFSRIGDLLPVLAGIVAALATAWTIVRPRRASSVGQPAAGSATE